MRLTIKENVENYKPKVAIVPTHNIIVDKLGQLEDIEDEIGVDLITLFKALKYGFYGTIYGVSKENAKAKNWKPTFYELKNIDIKKYDGKLAFIYYLGDLSYSDFFVYKFDDYGKTWALTEEELL